MGCTTAGEIGKGGHLDHSLTALGLPRNLFRVALGAVDNLRGFDPEAARSMAFDLRAGLTFSTADWANEVAFLLSDGLSLMEDQLVWALSDALGQSPLVGASAGDRLRFGQTFVLVERRLRSDAAVLAVLRTPCTVTAFRFDHLEPTPQRMVVTDADPAQRLVLEINGMPADPEYARILGKDPGQLSPFIFAANPVVSKIGDTHHVLAIQRVEPDGTLRFFSAIERGLVLRLAQGTDLAAHLDRHGVTRFNTYGEQFNMVHVTMVRTERLEREKLLDEQAQMMRATLDHIDQAVLIVDAKARLAGWNNRLREIFAPPSALLASGTPFSQLLNDLMRRRQLGRGNVHQVLTDWVNGPASRSPLGVELVQEDGTELHLSAQAMPDRGFVIAFSDLTGERRVIAEMHRLNETLEARVQARTEELEAARDAAERANAGKSRFVASASHDLLQPLNAAKLFLASLAAMDSAPAQARLIGRGQSAFASVEDIMAALLDLSKFDIGAARARVETVPLSPLVTRLRDEFQPMADRRGL